MAIEFLDDDDIWCIKFWATFPGSTRQFGVTAWIRDSGDGVNTFDEFTRIGQGESFRDCSQFGFLTKAVKGDFKVKVFE